MQFIRRKSYLFALLAFLLALAGYFCAAYAVARSQFFAFFAVWTVVWATTGFIVYFGAKKANSIYILFAVGLIFRLLGLFAIPSLSDDYFRFIWDGNLMLNSIKADIAILKINIAKTKITAPYSGIMGLRNISKGAYVTPATAIANLRQINSLKLEFSVPEVYTQSIRVGGPVSFTVQGTDKLYLANVLATENYIEQDNRSLRVRAIIAKADGQLTAGQFAKVNIALDANHAAYMVPSQAIIPKARTKEIIVLENGKANFRTITTGIRDSATVEILTGIKAGDTVIISGLMTIKPNAPVSISSIKP